MAEVPFMKVNEDIKREFRLFYKNNGDFKVIKLNYEIPKGKYNF